VVGCSPDPGRDSHRIASLLIDRGYDVVPVNPNCDEVLGRHAAPDLQTATAEGPIDVVDVFRRSEAAGVHVDEAIEIGAAAVWLQLGVIDEAAADRAATAGLTVVMDRCPAIEIPRLRIDGPAST
jgi:predicted CoA-binding protein